MIAIGAFSPLEDSWAARTTPASSRRMRLASGLPWTIPVTLAVDRGTAGSIGDAGEVALADESGHLLAVMRVDEHFEYDKKIEAEKVYRTTDEAHPGVAALYAQGDVLLGGPVTLVISHATASSPSPSRPKSPCVGRSPSAVRTSGLPDPQSDPPLARVPAKVPMRRSAFLLHRRRATKSDDGRRVRMSATGDPRAYYPADR